MSVTFGQAHAVIVHNGKVTRDAPAGATFSSPTDACYQEVSGTQYCSYRGAFGQNDIGQVSPDPVTVGESWMSRIDNTWAVDTRNPLYLHNTLRALSTGPTGRVAALATTGTVRGTTGAREGEKITGALQGRIDGTWRFAVDTGVFTDEDLRQTIDVTGTMHVSHKTRAATTHQVSRTTMQLLSIRAGQAQPLQAPERSKTYRDATLGFSIAYPATWQAQPLTSGGFEAATSDGNAAIVIGRYPEAQFGSPTDAASLPSLVRRFGEPVDPMVLGKTTMHGHEVRVVDTVLVNRNHVELQCEAQAIATAHGGYYLVSLVALGPPVWAQRLQHAAWLIEDMQRTLATMTIFPQGHTLY